MCFFFIHVFELTFLYYLFCICVLKMKVSFSNRSELKYPLQCTLEMSSESHFYEIKKKIKKIHKIKIKS